MRFLPFAVLTAAVFTAACGSDKPASDAPVGSAPVAEAEVSEPVPAAPAPAVLAAAPVSYASLTGDAVQGDKIFAKCRACHVVEAGKNRVGPSLHAVVGRTAGSVAGFNYSKANKGSGVVWTEEVLFTYLEAPQKFMPGTRMAFAGLKQAQDRADVIAYLKTK